MDREEVRQNGLENLILLVLGADARKCSVLHLEKEVFVLWNFHPSIDSFVRFIRHYHGPFSKEIQETIHKPMFLDDCWRYHPPAEGDDLSSGYVTLTEQGRRRYQEVVAKIPPGHELHSLMSAMKMVRTLYDKLSPKELLLLIYDTYPEYIEKSSVFDRIDRERKGLAREMLQKGAIDSERYETLLKE